MMQTARVLDFLFAERVAEQRYALRYRVPRCAFPSFGRRDLLRSSLFQPSGGLATVDQNMSSRTSSPRCRCAPLLLLLVRSELVIFVRRVWDLA